MAVILPQLLVLQSLKGCDSYDMWWQWRLWLKEVCNLLATLCQMARKQVDSCAKQCQGNQKDCKVARNLTKAERHTLDRLDIA